MSYIDDHPTNFVWTPDVQFMVDWLQAQHPFLTYVNTYWDHPPGPWADGLYDILSFDVWGGGLSRKGVYQGYRGKKLRPKLGKKVLNELFYAPVGPPIDWIIYRGHMWWNPATGGAGWTSSPPGPIDSDPAHMHHLHVTYVG